MVATIPDKLERGNYIFRIGMAYGNVRANRKPVVFYFESEEGKDEIQEETSGS